MKKYWGILFVCLFSLSKAQGLELWSFKEVVVEFKKKLSSHELQRISRKYQVHLVPFSSIKSSYFNRVYQAKLSPEQEFLLKQDPLVQNLEPVFGLETFSIIPDFERSPRTNDTLWGYQWGMSNRGQILVRPIDDLHSERIQGKRGYDIGWVNLERDLKKDIIVAVLDSGVDFNHPDLKNNIYKNKPECEKDGSLPLRPQEDKDHNGYKGDCMGWNFTARDKRLAHRPMDDSGHGTHVAGIIAAELNNHLGVAGFSNRIKILPVKVTMREKAEKQMASVPKGKKGKKKVLALSDRVAKGILYAVKMGAQVINLSLGWPMRMDTKYLREAFKFALDRGVSIVAAAGNNDNNSPLFPCAYRGVICVASVDNAGYFSDFSNFGGHVDFVAPGEDILSLYLSHEYALNFDSLGYAYKSGTSQAAPYVTAMVALLKAMGKGQNFEEIWARLFLSSKKVMTHTFKWVQGGLVQLNRALQWSPQPVVAPVFKEMDRILYQRSKKTIRLSLPIKSYWRQAKKVVVHVKSLNPNIIFLKKEFFIPVLSGQKFLSLRAQVKDDKKHSHLKFSVTISYKNTKPKTFLHEVVVSRALEGDSDVEEIDLPQGVWEQIRTVPVYKKSNLDVPEYYTLSKPKLDLNVNIYRLTQGKTRYKKVFTVSLPQAIRLISILKIDLDDDGVDDYFMRTLSKDTQSYIGFHFYFPNLKKKLTFKLNYQGKVAPSFREKRNFLNGSKDFFFIPWSLPRGQKIKLPLYLGRGQLPQRDLSSSPLDVNQDVLKKRLYFYEPEGHLIHLRAFAGPQFEEFVRNTLKKRFFEKVQFHALFKKDQKIHLLFSVGRGFVKDFYDVPVTTDLLYDGAKPFQKSSFSYMDIDGFSYFLSTDLTSLSPQFHVRPVLVGLLSSTRGQVVGIENLFAYDVVQKDKKDGLLNYLHGFWLPEGFYAFFLTKSHLFLNVFTKKGLVKIIKRSIIRSSFLPGHLFSETLYPIVFGAVKKGPRPAFYVNASQLSSRHVYLWVVQNSQLISPMYLDVSFSENCRPLNPHFWKESFAYIFSCKTTKKEYLKILPLQ
ncbi:MAG: hypothetical protein D6797_00170 [Bdellovibrio sp.]|nr:MAG: hypothetical protein D6797_00170 [Bdellovibrio sp.]